MAIICYFSATLFGHEEVTGSLWVATSQVLFSKDTVIAKRTVGSTSVFQQRSLRLGHRTPLIDKLASRVLC